jgi:hypothetical protein
MKKFRYFESAREFVQSQNLQSKTDWQKFCKSGNKPEDIPASPSTTYKKDWISWGDWLRNGMPILRKSKFYSFEDSKKFVQNLNLKNAHEWREYCTSGNRPDYITSVPERVYKNKGWTTLGDWLGTGTPSSRNRKYRSFEDAKKFVHKLKLKSESQWNEYCKSGETPDDIPQSAKHIYKNEFQNMGDWLGTGKIQSQQIIFKSFQESREFARSLKLKNNLEWQQFIKKNKLTDLPARPDNSYKNQGWVNWGDWLGTGNVATTKHEFLTYTEARAFVHTLKIKDQNEWTNYCNSGNRPENIPSNPIQVYKNKGWISFGDWSGTGNIADKNRTFRPYEDARKFAQSLNLKSPKEWSEYCKSGNKPDDIPSTPWIVYKEWNIKRREKTNDETV